MVNGRKDGKKSMQERLDRTFGMSVKTFAFKNKFESDFLPALGFNPWPLAQSKCEGGENSIYLAMLPTDLW